MKHLIIYLIIMLIFLLSSCVSSWKEVLKPYGNENDAVHNAIHDFLHTERLSKKDNVFGIGIESISKEVLAVSITGDENSMLVSTEDGVEFSYHGFPTRYLEKGDKLFYWSDENKNVTDDIIDAFTRYNFVDTMIVNVYIPERIIDDSKKGVDYYFCKNNLLKYKKVRTTIAIGWYNPPKLRCD